MLTAPTGIAAHNLRAGTIHSSFGIGNDVRLPYTPLGEEKLNYLRAKYSNLQIVIIDEISMVDHKLLAYIHGHLRQIQQSGNYSPFGNVSVIAVGDFYQLPPVKGKPLYLGDDSVGLWTQFQIVELKSIVRQKDVFAELLNRVRCRSNGNPMLDSDIQLLQHCETGEESSDLHIFPTNKQVSCHNIQQLFKSCPEYVQIEAKDFVNSKTTGKLVLKEGHHTKTYIVYPANDDKLPKMIYVKFDDDQVGTKRRSCSAFVAAIEMGSTGIEPEEERVTQHGGLRRQFPLKLAWACTVHTVQGLNVVYTKRKFGRSYDETCHASTSHSQI